NVLPFLRERIPNAELRLVGEPDSSVPNLARRAGVTVVGRVPDMEPELARADLVVVPIRFGSGTRVKILEAFAHRIAVVSTTIGAEGLGVENRKQLLIGDDPQDFARLCAELLLDDQLRLTLIERANELFLAKHQWTTARARIKSLAFELSNQAGR
ncbi:MAG TPA: glycosyltransferase family 4 protein, partial [Acidimicrobiales bacterium]|nr:glycosyltransferase family 4 protein [Acidimicrobiales bacterium]